MAFKFTVDYQQIKLVIQTDSTEAVSLFEHLKTTVQFIDMQQIVAFQQLTAADVFIDADTKNLYFSTQYNSPNAESFGFTDSDVFDFGKAASDTPIVSEELAKALDKALADTASVTEELSKVVQYFRDLADSYGFSDSEVLSVGLSKADTTTISESDAKDVGKAVDDSSSVPTTKTYTVTVATGTNVYGSGNKFYIDGLPSPGLILNESITYTFDQSDSSNSNHPFRFSTTGNGTHNSGSAYTTDVTVNGTPGSAGAYTRIVVSSSTPDLHYYCSNHSGMGAETSVQDDGDTTFAVTVATGVNNHGSGNKYYIDGVITPIVHLLTGNTYTFEQSDSSNSNHPFRFSETSNGSHASGTEYTTGVTTNGTPGSSGAYTRIQVTGSTSSTLYYYCTNHSGMGGEVNSSLASAGDMLMLDVPAKSFERPLSDAPNIAESLARAVTYQRTFTDAYALDDLASAEDNLATESGLNKSNVFSVTDVPVFSITKPAITDTITMSESLSFNFVGENSAFVDAFSLSDSPSLAIGPVDPFADTPSLSESLGLSFDTSFTDSATITESVEILFVPGGGSILNTSVLNTSVLN